nr:unnamed protein product [Callosobruchus chinensis]
MPEHVRQHHHHHRHNHHHRDLHYQYHPPCFPQWGPAPPCSHHHFVTGCLHCYRYHRRC